MKRYMYIEATEEKCEKASKGRENVPIQKRGREKETKVSPSEQNQQQQQFDLYADNGFGEKSVSRPA